MNCALFCFSLCTVIAIIWCQRTPSTCTVLGDVNGCSTPLRMPLPHKAQFTPSCNSHDVCYRCGKMYGWTQADCDKGFLNKMKASCSNPTKSTNGDVQQKQFISSAKAMSYVEFFKRLYDGWKKTTSNGTSKDEAKRIWNECLEIFKLFKKWRAVTNDAVRKCEHGAEIYFRTVRAFGVYAYRHTTVKDFCKEQCAFRIGNPM